MGILNVTSDSFFAASRCDTEELIAARAREIVEQGGDIIDIGGYSSRPNADDISVEEEMQRLRMGLKIVRSIYPDVIISVDTFRADVARMAVAEYGVNIINDISGGDADAEMFKTVAELNVPYILMHMRGTPQTMQSMCQYDDIVADIIKYFSERIYKLRALGVNDIVLDLGFGFSKGIDDNFKLLSCIEDFKPFNLPMLVGVSRKSMIYKHLTLTPNETLNGTTALNMYALTKGANILRVHDVAECVECVKLYTKLEGL